MIYILMNIGPIGLATALGLVASALYGRSAGGRLTPGVAAATVAGSFWIACILAGALILAPAEAGAWIMALGSAVVIWVGFVLPALIATLLYRGTKMGRTLADAAHWLVVMVIQAASLQAIGLTPPPGAPV